MVAYIIPIIILIVIFCSISRHRKRRGVRRKSARLDTGQRCTEMYGLPSRIHGSATQTPLPKLWQSVLRPLQQQQCSIASLWTYETRQSVQQVFLVPSDAVHCFPSHLHQLNVAVESFSIFDFLPIWLFFTHFLTGCLENSSFSFFTKRSTMLYCYTFFFPIFFTSYKQNYRLKIFYFSCLFSEKRSSFFF